MKSLNVNYKIESSSIDLALEGETFVGEPITLVNEDVNLIDDSSFRVDKQIKNLKKKYYECENNGVN